MLEWWKAALRSEEKIRKEDRDTDSHVDVAKGLEKDYKLERKTDRNQTYYSLTQHFLPLLCISEKSVFLHASLATDKIPAIVQGKCRVQRMSKLFAKHWALTSALQQLIFSFTLIFISIDKVKLINLCQGSFFWLQFDYFISNFPKWLMLKLYVAHTFSEDSEASISVVHLDNINKSTFWTFL